MATPDKFQSGAEHDEYVVSEFNLNVDRVAEIATGADHVEYSLWTVSMFRLYGCLLIGYLCATMNGFDGSVMGYTVFDPLKDPTNVFTVVSTP